MLAVLPLGGNPFAPTTPSLSNPFQAAKPPPPTINQLRAQNQFSAPFESTSSVQPVIQLQQTANNTVMTSFATSFPQPTQTHNPFAM